MYIFKPFIKKIYNFYFDAVNTESITIFVLRALMQGGNREVASLHTFKPPAPDG